MAEQHTSFKLSFIGEFDAHEYIVDYATYSNLRHQFAYDLSDWVTFRPYGSIRDVTINKRAVKKVVW